MTLYMGADTNTLLSFDGVEWRDRTSVGPSARSIASGAFDSKRKEFVLFGGLTGFPITFTPVAAETWVHDGTSWSPKSSLIAPDPRWGAAMAYDSRRDRTGDRGVEDRAQRHRSVAWWRGEPTARRRDRIIR